jgi:hypothetical protein
LIAALTIAGMIGWLAGVVWQLRLANTVGKVLSRNGYVTRDEIAFDGCVAFYWIALVWGTGMLIGMLVFAIKEISN